jgi:hypothetical protein
MLCFKKFDSEPPTCGLHDVRLIPRKELFDPDSPFLGLTNCFACPVSGLVIWTFKPAT